MLKIQSVHRGNVGRQRAQDKAAGNLELAVSKEGVLTAIIPKMKFSLIELFGEIDADSPGTLSLDELRSAMLAKGMEDPDVTELFVRCDKNDDGAVTMVEYTKGCKAWMKEKGCIERKPKPGHLKKELAMITTFAEIDVDGSGTLTQEELSKALSYKGVIKVDIEALFTLCDQDSDGILTMIEYAKGSKKWKEEHAEGYCQI